MPSRPLPNDPSLEHLRKEAKRLRQAFSSGDAGARALVMEFHPHAERALTRFSLTDAQLVTARAYGFASWARLKQHLTEVEPLIWNAPPPPDPAEPVDVFVRLACMTYSDWHESNPERARRMLVEHSGLVDSNIYAASAAGEVDAVRALIDRDPALVSEKGGPLGWEPLLYACYSRLDAVDGGHSTVEVARLLLSRGADPNAGFLWSGSYAFTALTGAFGRGEDWPNQPPHPECETLARLLLDAGADPNDSQVLYNRHFKDNDDHLTLLFEYGLGQEKNGPWLKRLTGENATPARMLAQQLCWAAMRGFHQRVTLLVEHGVDVNTPSPRSGRTPYLEALRAGQHAIADYLLAHGAVRIALDPVESFALACIAGDRREVQSRLAQDPTLLERLGHQGRVDLLHRAVAAKQPDGVRLIVALGVDVNGMVPGTGHDRSALHNAAGFGSLAMVRFLLELGADPDLRDPTFHATPIAWARHNRQQEIVDDLMRFASIFDAVACDGVERVAVLLQEDAARASSRDEAGNPLVFYLHPELERLHEMIALLTQHGADLNARSTNGKTVLDRALAHGWQDFAVLLRERGAMTSPELTAAASN